MGALRDESAISYHEDVETKTKWIVGGAAAFALFALLARSSKAAASEVGWRAKMLMRANEHVQAQTLYQWGGGHGWVDAYGLDCSGLVIDCCKAAGFVMQFNSDSIWKLCPHVELPQPADLALYGTDSHATHVTIVEKVTPDGMVAIIGANGGGSATTSPEVARAQNAFVKKVPTHLYRQGFLGFASLVDIAEGRRSGKAFSGMGLAG